MEPVVLLHSAVWGVGCSKRGAAVMKTGLGLRSWAVFQQFVQGCESCPCMSIQDYSE